MTNLYSTQNSSTIDLSLIDNNIENLLHKIYVLIVNMSYDFKDDYINCYNNYVSQLNRFFTSQRTNNMSSQVIGRPLCSTGPNSIPLPPQVTLQNVANESNFPTTPDIYRKNNRDGIPSNYSYSELEKLLLMFELLKLPVILDFLIKNQGKVFDIYTTSEKISIILDADKSPHLLGFLSAGEVKNLDEFDTKNNMEFYLELKRIINDARKDGRATGYLENIKYLILKYYSNIFSAETSVDSKYDTKVNFLKNSMKTSNLLQLGNSISINHLNDIIICRAYKLNGKNKVLAKNALLLLNPVKEVSNNTVIQSDKYIGIVIEKAKDSSTFYIKSDVLITKKIYENLDQKEIEGYYFEKSTSTYLALVSNDPDCIKKTTMADVVKGPVFSICSYYKEFYINKNKYTEICAKFSNRIYEKMTTLLHKLDEENIKNELPNLLYKYFLHCNEEDNEDIKLFYSFLADVYKSDSGILNCIKKCLVETDNNDKTLKFISSSDDGESIFSDVGNVKIITSIDIDSKKRYNEHIKAIKDELQEVKEGIESLHITTINNVTTYLSLLQNFFIVHYNLSNLESTFGNDESFESAITIMSNYKLAIENLKTINNGMICNILLEVGIIKKTKSEYMPYIMCLDFDNLLKSQGVSLEFINPDANDLISYIITGEIELYDGYADDLNFNSKKYILVSSELKLLFNLLELSNDMQSFKNNFKEIEGKAEILKDIIQRIDNINLDMYKNSQELAVG